jgi:hypothetical protein
MAPKNLRFGGGAADTLLHPLVAVAMVLAIILILCLPRRYGIVPFLLGVFLIPLGQVVVLSGVHFTVLRILILAGLVRKVTLRSGSSAGQLTSVKSIDSLISLWFGIEFIATSLELRESQAIINGLGNFLDAAGSYFVVRLFIRDREDVVRTLKAFAAITVVSSCCMINEQVTHQNVFGLLGGVPLFPQVREGSIRSQAAFAEYLDAGVFGATLIPLLMWMWSDVKSRVAAALGIAGAIVMMITSHSSTPLLAFLGAVVGLSLWPFRDWMRYLRWGLSLTLVGLHLVMKAPVWALIARIDLTGSSSGDHRYHLVDACIRHFSDWWLIGYKDFPNWGWDMWDLSDEYVAVALTGGLAGLVIFIKILSRSFGGIGTARKHAAGDRKKQWFLWCLGAALLAHVVGWFGCSYQAQMQILLFALFGIISVAVSEAASTPEEQPATADDTHQLQFWSQSKALDTVSS